MRLQEDMLETQKSGDDGRTDGLKEALGGRRMDTFEDVAPKTEAFGLDHWPGHGVKCISDSP